MNHPYGRPCVAAPLGAPDQLADRGPVPQITKGETDE